jgi:hypothetical protein
VLVAALTVTSVAVDRVGWSLYHCGAKFVSANRKPSGPGKKPVNGQNGSPK